MVPFKMADIVLDKDLFEEANTLSNEIIKNKELFNNKGYEEVLDIVSTNYNNNKEMLD